MGSINDPEDGKTVAATVFGAVVVYIVSFCLPHFVCWFYELTRLHSGFPRVLLWPSLAPQSATLRPATLTATCLFYFSLARLYWEQELGLIGAGVIIHVVLPD